MGTFADVTLRHARLHPARIACRFMPDGEGDGHTLTFAELDARARGLARALLANGAEGRPVLVLCPAGLDYVVALVACFYCRAIAVPAYPPAQVSLARTLPRVLAICADCSPAAILTTSSVARFLDSSTPLAQLLVQCPAVLVDAVDDTAKAPPLEALPTAADPALLQYTSGSTGTPKGVLITHGQLVANQELIQASTNVTTDDVFLSWLPPYHDMGLIGGILQPLYVGISAVLMPPDAFIRKPRRWLSAAQRHGATALLAPNFAFDLCVRRIPPEQREGLDLSSWRIVYNGAEPIYAPTLHAFTQAFAPHGFRAEAFYPCYGMAEATLIISGGQPDAAPIVRAYCADELEHGRAVEPRGGHEGGSGSTKLRRLVGCGSALLDEHILIVEPDTRRTLPARSVGEIWVKSRSVASGYWNRPEETAATFDAYTSNTNEGPFLRTGDLGFFDDGELFITGRLKDLIVVRGLNHYPQDIERTVQAVHPALVAEAGAAFALESKHGEQLVIVQELDKRTGESGEGLLSKIAQAVRDEHDLSPAAIVLIKRGSLFKTSSGKVQRRATRAAFESSELEVVASWRSQPEQPVQELAPAATLQPADAPRSEPPPRTHTRPVAHREHVIADWLRGHLAAKLKLDPSAIDPREPLARYGVDSLLAAELTEDLERFLDTELPSTISYDNPTIADLARVLADPSRAPAGRARRSTPELLTRSAGHAEDPIAIVGMACRFPGAPDLPSYWKLLQDGVDAITVIPRSRWDVDAVYHPEPGTPGKMCSRFGGLLPRIDEFDAAFFGIAPREAARMDPQQRLFLEVAWEALEDAGQSPAALAGSDAGVFAGVCTSDYAMLYGGDLQMIDGDYGTGSSPSIVANRLSYVLDLKGPSETVDSACSSSLVALQHAYRSLRNHDCGLAIVGGVNAVLAPESSVYFSQLRALAPDGRCKTFDSYADGFVRSEGAGVIVLKRLSRALADGDRVYALLAGTAVNHDGRSNGLLAPSGVAQQEVLRRALAAAECTPRDVDYVEAHGVGTQVADAVEMSALAAVLGERSGAPALRVGSVKTNIGHLEAASGMASLIKVALAMQHEELPPHLHLHAVSPSLQLEKTGIQIPTARSAWRRGERPRFAGVSAFGFGGTNAHVVLREAPVTLHRDNAIDRSAHVLPLSAKTEPALRALARRLLSRLADCTDAELADVCFTAGVGRSHLPQRLAVVCTHAGELRAALSAFVQHGTLAPNAHAGSLRPGARAHVGFAFLEPQVGPGSGRALFGSHPQFRQALELSAEILRPHLALPLLELLYGADQAKSASLLARASHAHAALCALQHALFTLYRGLGVDPVAVYGAGAGEYAAAAAAGAMSWEQALILATRRGLLLEGLAPGARQQLSVRQLKAELAAVDYVAPAVAFVSASLGRAFTLDEVPGAPHWSKHLYHAPRPADGSAALAAEGCDVLLELGPAHAAHARPAGCNWRATLAADPGDAHSWLEAIAALYACGVEIDWRAFDAPYARSKVELPSYPFERERYWLDFPQRTFAPSAPTVVERPSSHPLISRVRVHVPGRSGFVRKPDSGEGGEGMGSVG